MKDKIRITPAEVELEIQEKSRDLEIFSHARKIIRDRVLEVSDSSSSLTPLPHWSGTDAVLGSLDLAIHSMERTLDELKLIHRSILPSRPSFQIIDGGVDVKDPK